MLTCSFEIRDRVIVLRQPPFPCFSFEASQKQRLVLQVNVRLLVRCFFHYTTCQSSWQLFRIEPIAFGFCASPGRADPERRERTNLIRRTISIKRKTTRKKNEVSRWLNGSDGREPRNGNFFLVILVSSSRPNDLG